MTVGNNRIIYPVASRRSLTVKLEIYQILFFVVVVVVVVEFELYAEM